MHYRLKCTLLFLILHSVIVFGGTELSKEAPKSGVKFIPNKGQIIDRNKNARQDVLYQLGKQGCYLRNNGISYVMSNAGAVKQEVEQKVKAHSFSQNGIEELEMNKLREDLIAETGIKVQQIDMNFLGCNNDLEIIEIEQSTDYNNYYLEHCPLGILNVHSYSTIKYANLYPGIDAVFYAEHTEALKYDLKVQPFADPSVLRFSWEGADSVFINNKGELVLQNQVQTIYESIPLVYQLIEGDTIVIETTYRILSMSESETVVTYDIGNYDWSYPLIIDPWTTNYGGAGDDFGRELAIGPYGEIYMGGTTESSTMISESGFQLVAGGGDDAFLTRFNSEGDRIWGTYYGAAGKEQGEGVATDNSGNVYLAGLTDSPTGISFEGFQNDHGGSLDAFLVKFDDTGARIWATYYGGMFEDDALNVGVDSENNVYIIGLTLSETAIADGGHQNDFGGFADAFIVKFTPEGDRIFASYYGGIYAEIAYGIAFDKSDNAFVTGITTSPDLIATPGAFQEENGGAQDAFLVKFTKDGERLWGTYHGSLWVERGNAVAVDTSDNVYFAGKTTAPTATASPGAFQEDNGGISDAFLAKMNGEDGTELWTTYIGGELIDYAFAVEVDPISNNVIVAGETFSTEFPVSPCAPQSELAGDLNAYVTQFLPNGELFCSSYFGMEHEIESVMALDGCDVYIAGATTANISTMGAHQTTFGGEKDAFLAKVHLSSCGIIIPETTSFEQEQADVTSCSPCNGSATVSVIDFCLHPQALKTYTWSNGFEERYTTNVTSTIDGICEGEYWVAVTVNCELIDTFYFDIGNTASINADFVLMDACVDEVVEFENSSSTVFGTIISSNWDFGDGGVSDFTDANHTYDSPGEYEVKLVVENDSECIDSLIQTIVIFPDYVLEYNVELCEGESYTLPDGSLLEFENDSSLAFNYNTVNGCDSVITLNINFYPNYLSTEIFSVNEGEVFTYPDGTVDTLFTNSIHTSNFTTSTGCDSIIITTVAVVESPEPIIDPVFELPNVFTPGGDGANDTFFFPNAGVVSFNCEVYNRWGIQVFEFNSIADTWDGNSQLLGTPCTDGTYFYFYSGVFNTGEVFKGQGNVYLVRE